MAYLDLPFYFARRFSSKGEQLEDLIQVGAVGLIKAVDNFDPAKGVSFVGYAGPTIIGEIKRYFRDKGWALKIPRSLKELNKKVSETIDHLTQIKGSPPSMTEVASYLGISTEEAIEAFEIGQLYGSLSTEVKIEELPQNQMILETSQPPDSFDRLEYLSSLNFALSKIGEGERRIIYLRFFKDMTQQEIARELKISQMQVSRLLKKTLQKLRENIEK